MEMLSRGTRFTCGEAFNTKAKSAVCRPAISQKLRREIGTPFLHIQT